LSFEGSQVELSNPQGETSNLSLKPRMYQEIYFITHKKKEKKNMSCYGKFLKKAAQ
jgi:hypothetical protein